MSNKKRILPDEPYYIEDKHGEQHTVLKEIVEVCELAPHLTTRVSKESCISILDFHQQHILTRAKLKDYPNVAQTTREMHEMVSQIEKRVEEMREKKLISEDQMEEIAEAIATLTIASDTEVAKELEESCGCKFESPWLHK